MENSKELDALVSRIALGDHNAFRLLYQLTSAKLFGVCLRILNNRNDAEDVLQDVYVIIWNKADQYTSSKASAVAWLCAIARNKAIDRYRSRKTTGRDFSEMENLVDGAASPESSAINSDENRRLGMCFDELDPRHARAVRQTYLAGWSYQETADALEIPLNTVKTWIRRALFALRDCLNR